MPAASHIPVESAWMKALWAASVACALSPPSACRCP
jgi:hypothetical protein